MGSPPSEAIQELAQQQIIELTSGYWKSRALAVAAELELADLLVDGPHSVDVLAARSNTDPQSLFRMMRALESVGVFSQVAPRVFANTAASESLRKDVSGSMNAWVRLILSTGVGHYEAWAALRGAIETGHRTFDEKYGSSYWEFLRRNPDKSAHFNEAMRASSVGITPAVTESYDWNRFPIIADIGGGIGTQLVDILNANLGCRGILSDQPQVTAEAISHDRIKCVPGDFLKSVPAGADCYLLRFVIHDWADPEALTILQNVRKAVKPSSSLLLVESVVPETAEPSLFKWMDLHMLLMSGGRERTAGEYRELYSKAGFELERIVPTGSPASIIVGRPC